MLRDHLLHALQYAMMAFWCVFYGVVMTTNLCDELHRKRPDSFGARFRAQNREEVQTAVATVRGPPALASVLFALVIASQAVGCGLFAWALCTALAAPGLLWALLWNVGMWQAFVVADGIFRTYQFTVVHCVLLCGSLLTGLLFVA